MQTRSLVFFFSATLFACGGFYPRDPTTTLEVVHEAPEGSSAILKYPIGRWLEGADSPCGNPPLEIVQDAKKLGTDFLLVTRKDSRQIVRVTACQAYAYAISERPLCKGPQCPR